MRNPIRAAAFGVTFLASMAAQVATSQPPSKVVATRWTYVFVTPQVRHEALARIETGVELSVLGADGEWYLVEYESPRWGRRRGYIHRNDVRPVSEASKATTQLTATQRSASPKAPEVTVPAIVTPSSRPVPAPDKSSVDLKLLVVESFERAIAASPAAPITSRKVMIFGGRGHGTYLGCLNCPASATDSIFNKNGRYGGCPSAFADNLFCRGAFKEFGSSGPFHDESACANGASDPPVIVDGDGNYYGRFSVGGAFAHRDAVCDELSKFKHPDSCRTVQWVCRQ